MDYDEAVGYLEKCTVLGSKRGHNNLKKLLNMFDNPQEKLKIIHVAGTNGKGSTCAMLSSIFSCAGYSTGVFSSPHLEKYNERISINSINISDGDFAYEVGRVKEAVERLFEGTEEYFAFFEIITAVCFNYFFRKKVDYLILEVGLGGEFDPTNVITKPLLAVITSLSLEHTQYLGETIEEIAKAKGGIIKKNCPTVLYPQSEAVYGIIKGICDRANSKLYYVWDYNINIIESDFEKTIFSTCNDLIKYDKISLALIGDYQALNACNVLVCIRALRNLGLNIDDRYVLEGLQKAYIMGRMEVIAKKPVIILEGAHNIGGVTRLSNFMRRVGEKNKITLLLGVLADKDFGHMANMLAKLADNIVLTEPNSYRKLEVKKLYESLQYKENVRLVESDYRLAFEKAMELGDDIIICTGSLYLIGDLRLYYRREYNV